MAWFNRPEGFVTKSFDTAAPVIHEANDIRASNVHYMGDDTAPNNKDMCYADCGCAGGQPHEECEFIPSCSRCWMNTTSESELRALDGNR